MSETVAAALTMFQRYLDEEIPPAAASYALATLMAQPPDVLMQQVATWTAEQSRARSMPAGRLLLHALTQVYITGELQLLDREAVANYLDRVTGIALRLCPDASRDQLRGDLTTMRQSHTTTATLRQTSVEPARMPAVDPASEIEAQTARQYSLIFDRLTRQKESAGSNAPQTDPQAIAQLLAMAASRSQTSDQLNQYLDQLRPLSGFGDKNVFVILGGAMPSWDVSNFVPGTARPPSQVGAMEKIIELAESPEIAIKRFRELVNAAVEKFNQGALGAALWMLDVAEDSITEKRLDLIAVDPIRAEAVEMISATQLRKFAENKSRHAAVKIVLEFFPTLRLDALFRQLRVQEGADRRRSLLGFIEAYGAIGRDAALDEFDRELEREDHARYYLRNLVYLTHRIARESDDTIGRELAALAKSSEPGNLIYVVKESATALGQIRSDASVKLLTTRLAEFEAMLLRSDTSLYPTVEMQRLLDRIIGALARIGTSSALLTIARHGMRANPLLGDTRVRLASLAQHDLSFDEATVTVLLRALREELPGKLLGRRLPKKQESTIRLIESLSGTPSDETEAVFSDIANRFPDQDVGRAAAQALAKWSAPEPGARTEAAATLSGELEFFGLPTIVQSLAEMRATGMLTLTTRQKQSVAKLAFLEGKFLNAQMGQVRGDEAFYQALERPVTGTFAFVPYPPEKLGSDGAPREVLALLLEGMRRNDELQRFITLVPDDVTLMKTSIKPTPHADEDDPALVREVWIKASSGAPIAECERQLATDSFRVRRLVAHWLELGALVPLTA
jgi:hypothetical protein